MELPAGKVGGRSDGRHVAFGIEGEGRFAGGDIVSIVAAEFVGYQRPRCALCLQVGRGGEVKTCVEVLEFAIGIYPKFRETGIFGKRKRSDQGCIAALHCAGGRKRRGGVGGILNKIICAFDEARCLFTFYDVVEGNAGLVFGVCADVLLRFVKTGENGGCCRRGGEFGGEGSAEQAVGAVNGEIFLTRSVLDFALVVDGPAIVRFAPIDILRTVVIKHAAVVSHERIAVVPVTGKREGNGLAVFKRGREAEGRAEIVVARFQSEVGGVVGRIDEVFVVGRLDIIGRGSRHLGFGSDFRSECLIGVESGRNVSGQSL